jgi:4-diphosphocytidyl-2-C-methyl-D-erythritol kinase
VLRGLNELFNRPLVDEELHQIASPLGSDVPFFLGEGSTWCRGRGEILEAASPLPERTLLLIKPPLSVETAWAYKRYEQLKEVPTMYSQEEHTQSLGTIPIFNDLERPVFDKYLILSVMKSWLRKQQEVEAAFMTGSGSTMVAAIAPGAPEGTVTALRDHITEEFGPTFWMAETGFRGSDL